MRKFKGSEPKRALDRDISQPMALRMQDIRCFSQSVFSIASAASGLTPVAEEAEERLRRAVAKA